VFKLAPDGTVSILHKFDGGNRYGSVILDATGNMFGTSAFGGPNGNGAVWEILAR
jgi:hypothetical protein